ncbi:Gastrula zinc finger protein XlCGF57.1 [Armadillidium vulgare]|nr:Gastrula zinc finger protein XlCGF57.1 [Armadillidium vulgare]
MPMVLGTVTSARQFKEGQSDKIESVRDPFASTSYPHLMLSEEHHYSNYLEEGKGFACLLCRHVATTKGSLRRHMRRHTGERPYRCQFCPYGASQKSDLDKHSHLRPRVHVPTILPFSWSCSDNSALFDTPSRDMLFEQTFQCLLCSDHLSTKGSLARHMRKHTGERPFKCQICPYAAIQKSDLDRHIRQVTPPVAAFSFQRKRIPADVHAAAVTASAVAMQRGSSYLQCPLCPKKSKRRDHLRLHLRTHTGERPYACSFCPHRACQKRPLKNPERSMFGMFFLLQFEPSFPCQFCGKTFRWKGSLCVHLRTHTGERPYPCPDCDYRATDMSNLRRHSKRHSWTRADYA